MKSQWRWRGPRVRESFPWRKPLPCQQLCSLILLHRCFCIQLPWWCIFALNETGGFFFLAHWNFASDHIKPGPVSAFTPRLAEEDPLMSHLSNLKLTPFMFLAVKISSNSLKTESSMDITIIFGNHADSTFEKLIVITTISAIVLTLKFCPPTT